MGYSMDSGPLFESLRRSHRAGAQGINEASSAEHGSFQLRQDSFGWYLVTCGRDGREVRLPEHQSQGNLRKALVLHNTLAGSRTWTIAWGKEPGRIYTADHPDMMELVLACPGFLTLGSDGESIVFDPRPGRLQLAFTEHEGTALKSTVRFQPRQKQPCAEFSFITPSLVLCGHTLYRSETIAPNDSMMLFNTLIQPDEAEKASALFASAYPDAQIVYLDYTSALSAAKIPCTPALILESVDQTGILYLSAAASAEGADVDFINDYDVHLLASIDDQQKTLTLSRLEPCDVDSAAAAVARILKRLQDKHDPEGTFEQNGRLFIIERNLAVRFLEQELHTVLNDFTLLGSRELEKFHIRMVRPVVEFKESSGIDFLEGSAEVVLSGQRFALSEFFSRFETDRYILLNDGTKAIVEQNLIRKLKRLLKTDSSGEVKLSFFDLPAVRDLIDEKTASKQFISSRGVLEGFNTVLSTEPQPPELNAVLRDYQKRGFAWLHYLKRHNLGGCLADDMGLGKTVQTIALLATIYPGEPLPSLIVMPNSILLNWQQEVRRFAPRITAVIYHGTKRNFEQAAEAHLILTTYATVRNDIRKFEQQEFAYIVLDESQRIKNTGSQISKAVMMLNGRHRLALSGTPVENNIFELYSLYRFLNPAMFGTEEEFRRDYADPITRGGDSTAAEELKLKVYPFLLRRLKSEVLEELPEKIEQVIPVEMSPQQAALYEQRRVFYLAEIKRSIAAEGIMKARFLMLTAMNELRQIASIPENKSGGRVLSPKVGLLGDYLEEAVGNGHKALVFANYLGAIERIGEELESRGISYLQMTGATRNRGAVVESFQNSDEFDVLLMTLKTGGVGLNLTAADYVFLFDPWWNAAAENQAVDRVHRIGQKNSVFSYKLITRGSIEEKILQLQQNKLALVESLIESEGSRSQGEGKMLREEDIDFIFSGGSREW
jgi:superfamily II DNA or RNA helicase